MRLKKQRRHRKVVRFYSTCFGFRDPFKVLCDGTFVHHLVSQRFTSFEKAVSNTLGGSVMLFTTRCVIAELKSLGDSHAESLKAARDKFKIARCDHEKRISAVACIMEIIGDKNPEHFFVATQDTDLRRKFQERPSIPLLFGLRTALFLEQPSSTEREFVKLAEEERLHMTESEYKRLEKQVKCNLNAEEWKDTATPDDDDGNENLVDRVVKRKKDARKRLDVKDKVQFKRKKSKGPNPLSCKKKKNTGSSGSNSGKGQEGENGNETERRQHRKRKRSRRGKHRVVTNGQSNLA